MTLFLNSNQGLSSQNLFYNGWTEDQDYLKEIAQSIQNDNFIPSSTTNTLSYLLKHWQNKNPNCMVGEKTPAHIYYAEQIFKEFPNAKFIITVRDPRGIALSEMVKLAQNPRNKANFNLFSFIVRWQTAHNLAKKWQEKFGTEKVKYIKYEDIILQPQQTVLELCNFLEIAFLPEMLEVGVVNSSFLDLKQKDKRFNTENLTRWKEGLSKQQIALIQYHLSSSMKELGYDIEEVDNQLLTKEINLYLEQKKLKVILVMSILLVIILRSFVWEFGQYLHFGDYKALLTIGFFALLGKSLGGFFSDKMDQWVFLISTWSISIICFLINKDNIIMQSIGFGFLQASLPLSILQLSSFFPNKIGFAVGLALGIGVLIGGIPFLKIDINSISGVVLFGSLVTSLGLILFLKWKSKN
jgi:hypothetical protein